MINLWLAAASGGYAPEGYRAAFAVTMALQAAELLWFGVYGKPKV